MKKIMFHLNCLEQGGAERVVTTLANWFENKEDYHVIIATESKGENEFSVVPEIERFVVGLNEKQEKRGRIAKFFCRVTNLRKLIKAEKPDMIIAFARKASYRALMATWGTKVPVIFSVRITPYLFYTGFFNSVMIALLYPRAAGAIFQTEGAKAFFSKKIQKKSTIILNPINDKYLNQQWEGKRRNAVVHSGRLVDFKNQELLVRAFLQVHEKHPELSLEIYGPDSKDGTKEKLLKLIKENAAEEYVKLMGGSDSLEKQLTDGKLYAFSSDYEGLPNALMEAMALGLPVVATDCPCGGPATLIQHEKNGLLVPVKDEDALAAGMLRLIEDEAFAEKLGREAANIKEIAGTEVVCQQWKTYIEERLG